MTKPTDTGMNRTGIAMSPVQGSRMTEGKDCTSPRMPGEQLALAEVRRRYIADAEPVGTVPPPGTVKGMAQTALEMLKGHKPTVFIDKLGERLAFERTGVRLYEALLTKYDVIGTWEGGPSREELDTIRQEELQHFHLLKETMERLGADPTAMTPSADIVALESAGILKVITDPRTTLSQSLHAQLVAERADIEGWDMLIELADSIGQTELASSFREAYQAEERHARLVKNWLSQAVAQDAQRELQETSAG